MKKKSRRSASPAQLRARKAFAAMARGGKFKRRIKGRIKPKAKHPMRLGRRSRRLNAWAARINPKRAPQRKYLIVLTRNDGKKWYFARSVGRLTTDAREARRFSSESDALALARRKMDDLTRLGFTKASTIVS